MKQLLGYDTDGKKVPYRLGHFFMAIDIEAFIEVDDFKKTTGDILRQLRDSQKVPGAERIYTCGEKEHLAGIAREGKGVPINAALQEQMITMRNELNLTGYRFPFD